MPSLSDRLLAGGCALHVEAFHGEIIKVLSGADTGKEFSAVQETESDMLLATDQGEDRRAKRILRFRDGQVPNLSPQDLIQTSDGKHWNATRHPLDGYLSSDFELHEIAEGIDT